MNINTLIIDDTVTYRKIASEVAASFSDVTVVGTASSGRLALKKMEQRPVDLVFCDVHMPEMDGVETLSQIKKRFPQTQVVMMSGISSRSAEITIRALEMGAIDFVKKPTDSSVQQNIIHLTKDFATVLRLVKIRLSTRGIAKEAPRPKPEPEATPKPKKAKITVSTPRVFGICAIGVSTGGPEALNKLIPELPRNLAVPIVLVQHMPAHFTQSLAERLNQKSTLAVREARDGDPLKPGTVYVAPGGRHMIVRNSESLPVIGINDQPPENSCRPSVDVLFRSVANVFGDLGILTIMLTGMGNDGVKGVRSMKRKGCFCITQSEASCVVYGMPRAVDEAGLSDVSLPLEQIVKEVKFRLNC